MNDVGEICAADLLDIVRVQKELGYDHGADFVKELERELEDQLGVGWHRASEGRPSDGFGLLRLVSSFGLSRMADGGLPRIADSFRRGFG